MLSLCWCSARAQNPGSVDRIEISAPQSFVVSARTLQLQARAFTFSGATVSIIPQWRSSNPAVAEVSLSGLVRGKSPGVTQIEATASGVGGRLSVRVFPGRIEIKPERLELQRWQRSIATVRALDADGKVLPNLEFSWFSGLPSIASVDKAGSVTAWAEGSTTLTARLDVPGITPAFSAQVRVTVRRRPDFQISRLISNDFQVRPVTLKNIREISYAYSDRVALIGGLSNGSQALFQYDSSGLKPLLTTGDFLDVVGQVITGFGPVSTNSRGDVLAAANLASWPHQAIVLFRAGSAQPELVILPSEFCNGCAGISYRSLGDNGEIVLTTGNQDGSHVLLRRESGKFERISSRNSMPEFGPVEWYGGVSITPSGKVVFSANVPGKWGFFYWDGTTIRKIFITGESILGRTVHGASEPLEGSPGEFYLQTHSNQIAKFSGGVWSPVVQSGQVLNSIAGQVRWVGQLFDVRGNTVLVNIGSDQGPLLLRLDRGVAETVARFGGAAEKDEWREIRQAFLRPDGTILIQGIQGAAQKLARSGGAVSTSLVQTGTGLNMAASTSLDWWNLAGGGSAGNLVFSAPAGLVRVAPDSIQLAVGPGDSLPGGEVLVNLQGVGANRKGEFAFTADTTQGQGLYLFRNGRVNLFTLTNGEIKAPGGGTIHNLCCGPIALNNNSQVVANAGFDQFGGLLLFSPGEKSARSVMIQNAPAPGGGNYQGPNQWSIDDKGRVLFTTNLSDGTYSAFLWENGQARTVLRIGDRPLGNRVMGFGNPQTSGSAFYLFLWYDNGQQELALFDGAGWRSLLNNWNSTVSGERINHFRNNHVAVSTSGDIAYVAGLQGGTAVVLRRSDGRDLIAARINDRSPEGDWFYDFLGATINEQGLVFFSGLTTGSKDRLGLYQAVSTERSRRLP